MRALGLPRDEPDTQASRAAAATSAKVESWHGSRGAANPIIIEADRPRGAEEEELDQWRNEIRWAGLLRVRCGCCG